MPINDIFRKKMGIDKTQVAAQSPSSRKRSLPLQDLSEELVSALVPSPSDAASVFPPSAHSRLAAPDVAVLLSASFGPSMAYFMQFLQSRGDQAVKMAKFIIDVNGFESACACVSQKTLLNSRTKTSCSPNPLSSPSVQLNGATDRQCQLTTPSTLSPNGSSRDLEGIRNKSCSNDSVDSGFSAIFHSTTSTSEDTSTVQDDEEYDHTMGSPLHDETAPLDQEADPEENEMLRNRTKDAVEIFQRYVAPICPHPIPLPMAVKEEIVQGICSESGRVDPQCFNSAKAYVCALLERDHFHDYLRSEWHAKCQLDILTEGGDGSKSIGMADVLYDDALLFRFTEFIEAEGDRSLLEFFMSTGHFRASAADASINEEERGRDAMQIYERFVSFQATTPLGFQNSMRSRIEESICSASGRVSPNCFDEASLLVVRVLQLKYLNRFLNSALFKKYVSELMSAVEASLHNRSKSDPLLRTSDSANSMGVASTADLSSHNTLLAMSRMPPLQRDALGDCNASLHSADAHSVSDEPDSVSLWRRRNHNAVNIGQIDHLGRYRSLIERPPELSASSHKTQIGTKLTRAVKRLVGHDDVDAAQEEMAWQMAEMIVGDITRVTLNSEQSAKSNQHKRCSQSNEKINSLRQNS